MKKIKPASWVLIILTFVLSVTTGSCRKKDLPPPPPPPPPPTPVVNTPPKVSAGPNICLLLPLDSVSLSGQVYDAENNIDSYRWTQLSGPSPAIVQAPNSLETKISKLTKGDYNFELTVADKENLSGKANVKVLVFDSSDIGTNTLILPVLDITCWGPECTLLVDTSTTHLYQNRPIKVYLKAVVSPVWVEIPQQNHFFSSGGGAFWIEWYGIDDRVKWEVMIVY